MKKYIFLLSFLVLLIPLATAAIDPYIKPAGMNFTANNSITLQPIQSFSVTIGDNVQTLNSFEQSNDGWAVSGTTNYSKQYATVGNYALYGNISYNTYTSVLTKSIDLTNINSIQIDGFSENGAYIYIQGLDRRSDEVSANGTFTDLEIDVSYLFGTHTVEIGVGLHECSYPGMVCTQSLGDSYFAFDNIRLNEDITLTTTTGTIESYINQSLQNPIDFTYHNEPLYQNNSYSNINSTNNHNGLLTPTQINFTFSESTDYIIHNNLSGNPVSGTGTSVQFNVADYPEDIIKLEFHNSSTGFQQLYAFENDQTQQNIELFIQDLDATQHFKVSGPDLIPEAQVCAQIADGGEYKTIFCDYTDIIGIVEIGITADNTYQITSNKENYNIYTNNQFFFTGEEDVLAIKMTPTNSPSDEYYIVPSCPKIVTNEDLVDKHNNLCTFWIWSADELDNASISYFRNNTGIWYTDNINNAFQENGFTVPIYIHQLPMNFTLSLEDINILNYTITIQNNVTSEIGWEMEGTNFGSILENMEDNPTNKTIVYTILLIIGALVGAAGYKAWGSLGTISALLIYFLFMQISGITIFFIPVAVLSIYLMGELLKTITKT